MNNGDKMQQVNIELRHEISGDPGLKKTKSYLILDSEILPDIKKWKIGENYEVKLIVQQLSLGQDDNISALEYYRNKVIAKFEVIKATEAEEE
jgi:hypothetical protein